MSTTRRRRRRRAAITLAVVGLMLLATFLYAAAYFQGWVGKDDAGPSAPCTTTTTAAPPAPALPAKVTVNVYNATDRNGLAASVAAALRKQGFQVAKVANDPLGRSIAGSGEVRRGSKGAAAAVTVRQRLSSAEEVLDNRTDASVDLVLGEAFQKLSAPPVPQKTTATKKPAPSPSTAPKQDGTSGTPTPC